VVNGILVFQIKFCVKSPALQVAAKRRSSQPFFEQYKTLNDLKGQEKNLFSPVCVLLTYIFGADYLLDGSLVLMP